MASYRLNNMNFSFSVRRAPKSGPTSSDKWNDTMDEISRDLTNIALEWNQKLVPIISGLPGGIQDTAINAFVNGLDGANMWVDGDTDSDDQGGRYYNAVRARPNTIREQFEGVYSTITTELVTVQSNVLASAGLTPEAKSRIGARIFDTAAVSSTTSLDGVSAANAQDIIQISQDLYGDDAALNADGNAILTNSIKTMLGALLDIHNGAWDDDAGVSHAGVVSVDQNHVDTSHAGNDSYFGDPIDLEGDLDRIRTEIKVVRGTAGWQAANSYLYGAGPSEPNSLEDLLVLTQGQGTKSANNPWGYRYDDVDGLVERMEAANTFMGRTSLLDTSPNYGLPTFISNGNPLHVAVSGLDKVAASHSGVIVDHTSQIDAMELFIGQEIDEQTQPNFTSTQVIGDSTSLTEAVSKLDEATVSGMNAFDQAQALGGFTGQVGTATTSPTYDSTQFITQGLHLQGTIGELDQALVEVSGLATSAFRSFSAITVSGHVLNDPPTDHIVGVSVAVSGHMVTVSGDVVLLHRGAGVILTSDNGSQYRVHIDDGGTLQTTAV